MGSLIEVFNAHSKLTTSRDVLREVRRAVAYRAQDLPPKEVQAAIKYLFHRQRRRGERQDMMTVVEDDRCRDAMIATGFDPHDLIAGMITKTLRMPGTWDGWTSAISSDGTFSTGLLSLVVRQLCPIRLGVPYRVDDQRDLVAPRGPLAGPIDLRDYQRDAIDAFMAAHRGVIEMPPRTGKTRTAAEVISRLALKTLFIVPSVGLVDQATADLRKLLGRANVMGIHSGAGKDHRMLRHTLVWGSTYASAKTLPLDQIGFIVIDECHHGAAVTVNMISAACSNAYWRLAITGTNYRADRLGLILRGVVGGVVYRCSPQSMMAAGWIAPAKVAVLRMRLPRAGGFGGSDAYRVGIVGSAARNGMCAHAAAILAKDYGKRVIMLTKEIDHARDLASLVVRCGVGHGKVAQVDGENNEAATNALKALASGRLSVVVGTGVIGEGRDVPAADALVYAAGGRSRVRVVQDAYRVLTANIGKRHGILVDFADTHHPNLEDASAARLGLYRGNGAFHADVIDATTLESWIASVESDHPARSV